VRFCVGFELFLFLLEVGLFLLDFGDLRLGPIQLGLLGSI
jgi:hypothetical protein